MSSLSDSDLRNWCCKPIQTPVKLSEENFKSVEKKHCKVGSAVMSFLSAHSEERVFNQRRQVFSQGAIAFITVVGLLPIHLHCNSTSGACTPSIQAILLVPKGTAFGMTELPITKR